MRTTLYAAIALLLLTASFGACGPGEVCKAGETKPCQCADLKGTQTCKDDRTGFQVCRCGNTQTEPSDEPDQTSDSSESSTPDEPASTPDEPASTPDEPTSPDDAGADESTPEPSPEPSPEPKPEPNCTSDEFLYLGKCYKAADFCQGQIQEPGFPAFTANDQKAMKQPFAIVFDNVSNKPLFCETKDGYYYLSGAGYGVCDIDGDGWVNIEAYRALTSAERPIQDNARCKLKKFQHIVYHAEGQSPQVQKLKNEAAMVETFRNDGGEKLIELPVYTKGQAPLPKNTSNGCTADADCSSDQACYRGHCITGRRFEPAEINTLTKGCISGLDLNDNQLDDANESPGSIPTPAGEFSPLITAGYFMELHHGHYQADYSNNGTQIPVYHIYERPRDKAANQQGLALNCQEKTDAFQPDFWKSCALKDNQQCHDPNDPSKLKKGHNACWLPNVKRLIPSLFQCVVFDNTAGYHFNPSNYGFDKNYNRTICDFKAVLNASDPTKRDIQFECTADTGSRQPDPAKQEVGWACQSFQAYNTPDDYEGGCVDQTAEKVCGTKEGGEDVTYIKLEDGSYGLTRAWAACGTATGQGQCSKARKTCTGGTWQTCDKCDNCPQVTTGQKTACPNGTWPADSCKVKSGPTPEVCDGQDNDCDGQIDEGLPQVAFYLDKDNDGFGAGSSILRCAQQAPKGYVNKAGDCNDNDKLTKPGAPEICDGQDNNCNGQADEGVAKVDFFKDDDLDGYRGAFAFKGCYKPNTSNQIVCRGPNDCISTAYGTQGAIYLTNDGKASDCCDSNKDVNPGQTNYFNAPYTCGSNPPSFDYDCNQKEDKDIGTCQCSKTVQYRLTHSITCRYGNDSFDKDWADHQVGPSACSNGSCTKTLTNQNSLDACIIDVTHTFKSTGSHREKKTCCSGGSQTYKCDSFTATSYKPEYSPNGGSPQKYLVFQTSKWLPVNGKCAFFTNGDEVKCGSSGVAIIDSSDSVTAPTRKKTHEFCKKTTPLCCGNSWTGECKYVFDIEYNKSNYKYFNYGAKQFGQTVKCR